MYSQNYALNSNHTKVCRENLSVDAYFWNLHGALQYDYRALGNQNDASTKEDVSWT